MNFNAHEMSAIRAGIEYLAMLEFGPHVQQARQLRERFSLVVKKPDNVTIHGPAVKSQEAFDKLLAHAHHGFKHGHFKGSFGLDGGTYDFETYTERVCYKEDYHNGHFYTGVPRVKFTFTPWSTGGWLGETVEMET